MNIDFAFFFRLFWRRLPVMMIFFIGGTVIGALVALRLPETYQTDALLSVQSSQIPDSMVESVIQTQAIEQLEIIEQKLLRRANLIDIAQRFSVFENMGQMEPDTVVQAMRENTRIRRRAGRNRATIMTISFQGRSPQIVSNVVNEYVTLVLEENSDFRVSRARNTLDFFEREVERLASDLDRKSEAIAVFKRENADALPEEQSFRLGRLTLLQERVARTEVEIAALTARRDDLVQLFEQTGSFAGPGQPTRQPSPEERQLVSLNANLNVLLSDYSEENPRVKRLRNQIERLEAVVTAQKEAEVAPSEDGGQISAERALLEANLRQIDTTLKFQRDELERTQTEIVDLQDAISRSSANGIELNALQREYDITLSRYNAAVVNLNGAQMSQRIEDTAQGQRIEVIESASVPSVPAGPDRPKIAIAGAGAGTLLAVAYFVLLEILNRTVRRPAELVNRFNITPITTIPYMESRGRRFARRAGLICATLAVVVGVPALLWYIDQTYLPLEVLVDRGLSRLGLDSLSIF